MCSCWLRLLLLIQVTFLVQIHLLASLQLWALIDLVLVIHNTISLLLPYRLGLCAYLIRFTNRIQLLRSDRLRCVSYIYFIRNFILSIRLRNTLLFLKPYWLWRSSYLLLRIVWKGLRLLSSDWFGRVSHLWGLDRIIDTNIAFNKLRSNRLGGSSDLLVVIFLGERWGLLCILYGFGFCSNWLWDISYLLARRIFYLVLLSIDLLIRIVINRILLASYLLLFL